MRRVAALLLAAPLLVGAVACGGDGPAPGGPAATSAEGPTTTPAASQSLQQRAEALAAETGDLNGRRAGNEDYIAVFDEFATANCGAMLTSFVYSGPTPPSGPADMAVTAISEDGDVGMVTLTGNDEPTPWVRTGGVWRMDCFRDGIVVEAE